MVLILNFLNFLLSVCVCVHVIMSSKHFCSSHLATDAIGGLHFSSTSLSKWQAQIPTGHTVIGGLFQLWKHSTSSCHHSLHFHNRIQVTLPQLAQLVTDGQLADAHMNLVHNTAILWEMLCRDDHFVCHFIEDLEHGFGGISEPNSQYWTVLREITITYLENRKHTDNILVNKHVNK
jgi:hypothetical protein